MLRVELFRHAVFVVAGAVTLGAAACRTDAEPAAADGQPTLEVQSAPVDTVPPPHQLGVPAHDPPMPLPPAEPASPAQPPHQPGDPTGAVPRPLPPVEPGPPSPPPPHRATPPAEDPPMPLPRAEPASPAQQRPQRPGR